VAPRHAVVSARALWAGPGARRALLSAASGTVMFALEPGGYVRLGGEWLLLAIPRAPRGPLTLLVAGLEAAPLAAGDEIALTDERRLSQPLVVQFDARVLRVGALRVDLSRIGRPPLALAVPPLAPGWRLALTAALEVAPVAPRELADGLAALRHGDDDVGVAALAGRGAGLTPAGDDALAGYAAWRHAAGEPVAFDGNRCSPLGLAYLRCAERGELPEPVAALMRAIRAGDAVVSERRARALSRWGASSGAAMLWGIAAAASS
jgi:hypothetical protein